MTLSKFERRILSRVSYQTYTFMLTQEREIVKEVKPMRVPIAEHRGNHVLLRRVSQD